MSDEQERRVRDAERLVRIEGKIDGLVSRAESDRVYTHSLSARVRALEQFRSLLYGLASITGFMGLVAWAVGILKGGN